MAYIHSTFQKPRDVRYVDMAIYIDGHIDDIMEQGKHPDVEQKVYQYIYLISFMLAYKYRLFGRMQLYYDDFALYMASNVYTALIRKRLQAEAGKTFHGKPIKPIKSVMNYIKATLYPAKVDYQRLTYREVINPAITGSTARYAEKLTADIQSDYVGDLKEAFDLAVDAMPELMGVVLERAPFRNDPVLRQKIINSVYLTLIDQLTLPTSVKNKIEKRRETNTSWELSMKFMRAHEAMENPVRLWHLDPSYANYVAVLTKRLKAEIGKKAQYYIHDSELSAELVDRVMASAYSTFEDNEVEE